mmetsp:Transcript_13931/g.16190  ORF Transcript_13931/g.16190 Transcript_13931/m.16190 type:complete len:834 (+) Transcript_13931:382-2883(+)
MPTAKEVDPTGTPVGHDDDEVTNSKENEKVADSTTTTPSSESAITSTSTSTSSASVTATSTPNENRPESITNNNNENTQSELKEDDTSDTNSFKTADDDADDDGSGEDNDNTNLVHQINEGNHQTLNETANPRINETATSTTSAAAETTATAMEVEKEITIDLENVGDTDKNVLEILEISDDEDNTNANDGKDDKQKDKDDNDDEVQIIEKTTSAATTAPATTSPPATTEKEGPGDNHAPHFEPYDPDDDDELDELDNDLEDDEEIYNDSDDNIDDEDDDDDNNTESDSDDSDTDIEDEKNTKLVKSNNKYSLFLRNLPFDTTRHDLFTLFAKYGHIDSIYVVKDQTTGLTKGTAFVNFSKEGGYMRALEASHDGDIENTYDFKSGKNIMTSLDGGSSGGLFLRGRRILIDKAVDKNTAESLKVERDEDGKPVDKKTGKDKRNLYLKGEGRVAEGLEDSYNVDAWENLPQGDQFKRGRAHQEKHTKLRSPLFFINPYRLSLRNLAKNVDESQLKLMVAAGIKNGLEKNLVTKDDIIAHWRAGGEMTTRDIIEKQKALEEDGDNDGGIIPPFDESDGIKKFIPSVFIDRDFQSKDAKVSKTLAPSRGFGFAEFTHHAHALACLRELNNNIAYAAEFVAGGKRALEMKKHAATRKKKKQKKDLVGDDDGAANDGFIGEDGKVRIPRLLVEFTVENKAKARMQAERKAQQQANVQKQRVSAKKSKGKKDKDKKGRGAQQREKKRKRKEQGLPEKDDSTLVVNATKKQKLVQKDNVDETNDTLKKKSIKPQMMKVHLKIWYNHTKRHLEVGKRQKWLKQRMNALKSPKKDGLSRSHF